MKWVSLLVAALLLLALAPAILSLTRNAPPPIASLDETSDPWETETSGDPQWVDAAGFDDLSTGPPAAAEEPRELGLDCLIVPFEEIEIRSPVVGRIESIAVDRADPIQEGDLLVKLESDVESAAVQLAQARARMRSKLELQEARHELGQHRKSRAEHLYAKNALSLDLNQEVATEAKVARLEAKEARDEVEIASIELKQARAALKRRQIHSPISGVVVERLMATGEVVDEDVIMRIAQIDPLRVEVILPASRFGSVTPGTKAMITSEIRPDQAHVATVTVVDRVIDAASGTFGVRLDLPNPDLSIPGGLPCEIQLVEESASN